MKNIKRRNTEQNSYDTLKEKLSTALTIFLSHFPSLIPLVRNTTFHFGDSTAKTLATFTYKDFQNAIFDIFIPIEEISTFSVTTPWNSPLNLYTTLLHEYLHIIFYHFEFPKDSKSEKQLQKFKYACEYVLDRFIIEEVKSEIITPQKFYHSFIEIFEKSVDTYSKIPAKYLNPWEIYQHISDKDLETIAKLVPSGNECLLWNKPAHKGWGDKNEGGTNLIKIVRKNFLRDISTSNPLFDIVPNNIQKWKEAVERIEMELTKWDWSEVDEETISLLNYTKIVPYHPKKIDIASDQIVLILDVSSSMSYEELVVGISVIASKYTVKKVITHSTVVLQVLEFNQLLNEHLRVSGDTRCSEVFEYILKNYPNEIKIHITDGWCFEDVELPKELTEKYIFVFTGEPTTHWLKYKHIILDKAKSISDKF